ncbi:MAG TPA: hypothetical protein VF723_13400 [Pyrinomonadaceae bacterium]|jgi:hypothetical protein
MNTGTRRFILRLLVGLLTFLLGVSAAILLGGFSPMARFNSRSMRYRHHECGRGWTAPPPAVLPGSVHSERYFLRGPAGIREELRITEESLELLPDAPLPPDLPSPPHHAPHTYYELR